MQELTIANNCLLKEVGSGPIARASAGGEGAGNQGAVGGSSLGASVMITAAVQDSAAANAKKYITQSDVSVKKRTYMP